MKPTAASLRSCLARLTAICLEKSRPKPAIGLSFAKLGVIALSEKSNPNCATFARTPTRNETAKMMPRKREHRRNRLRDEDPRGSHREVVVGSRSREKALSTMPKIVGSAILSRPYNTKTMTKKMVDARQLLAARNLTLLAGVGTPFRGGLFGLFRFSQ